jgi:hypothetical protein
MNSSHIAGLIILAIVIVAAGFYLAPPSNEQADACISSGGTVQKTLCCKATGDFPNLCSIGACGCAPDQSHEVLVCDCGEGRCFDGEKCTDVQGPPDVDCISSTGSRMSLSEAQEIAAGSACADTGTLLDEAFCNADTGTWWIDLEPFSPQEGCNPACVVNLETGVAEVNWRCTGAIPE